MEENNNKPANNPIKKKEDVQKSNDEHIDQDFPGYPNLPSKENIINPKTKTDKIVAGIRHGENNTQPNTANNESQDSDGSANAFHSTETFEDDEDSNYLDEK